MLTYLFARSRRFLFALAALTLALAPWTSSAAAGASGAVTNPLWREAKTRNYLPDMTWPEVQALLARTDMVIIPVGSLEEHGPQGPIGTDFYNGVEQAKLIAQKTDVLVAPVLMPGNSPYHMGFPGTITLSAETLERVYFEAVQSLLKHGFRRFVLLNAHGGNAATTRFIVDRINQETAGVAVELTEAAQPFSDAKHTPDEVRAENEALAPVRGFDRHSGVEETSQSLYLIPSLVDLRSTERSTITLPPHLQAMLPQVIAHERTADLLFLAEALKAKETGKHTSTREMTPTGNWSQADIAKEASSARGKARTDAFVSASVQFIEAWKKSRPIRPE